MQRINCGQDSTDQEHVSKMVNMFAHESKTTPLVAGSSENPHPSMHVSFNIPPVVLARHSSTPKPKERHEALSPPPRSRPWRYRQMDERLVEDGGFTIPRKSKKTACATCGDLGVVPVPCRLCNCLGFLRVGCKVCKGHLSGPSKSKTETQQDGVPKYLNMCNACQEQTNIRPCPQCPGGGYVVEECDQC
jgi:RNase P subunit RPR2